MSALVTVPQYDSKHWLTFYVQEVLENPVKNWWLWKEDQTVRLATASELEEMPQSAGQLLCILQWENPVHCLLILQFCSVLYSHFPG